MLEPALLYGQLRLRQLQLLVWVGEGMRLAQAAQRLALTPAAVSSMLSEMEAQLGHVLCTRTRAALEPTPQGRALAERARVVLAEFEGFGAQAQRPNAAPALRLGLIPQAAVQCLPSIAVRFSQLAAGCLQAVEGTSEDLVAQVALGRLSAAVVRTGLGGLPTTVLQESLGYEDAVMVLPASLARSAWRSSGKALPVGQLEWVLSAAPAHMRRLLEQEFARHSWPLPVPVLEVTTTVQALHCVTRMCELGKAVATVAPATLVRALGLQKSTHVSVWPKPLAERTGLALVWRRSQEERQDFVALRQAVLQVAPRMLGA